MSSDKPDVILLMEYVIHNGYEFNVMEENALVPGDCQLPEIREPQRIIIF